MFRRDPIVTSSPPPPAGAPAARRTPPSHADSDDEVAELFVTQPTQPLHTTQPTLPLNNARSPFFALPGGAAGITQPTQILKTQPTQILSTPPRPQKYTQVLVTRSSPSQRQTSPVMSQSQSQSQRHMPMSLMQPPGTSMFFPRPAPPPPVVDLVSDPPVEPDSEEEDVGSNIRPDTLEARSFRIAETPQKGFDFSHFAYSGNGNGKRAANGSPEYAPVDKRIRQSGPSRAMPVQHGPSRAMPVLTRMGDIQDLNMRIKVQRLMNLVPQKSVQELYDALVKVKGNYEDAIELVTRESPEPQQLLFSSPSTDELHRSSHGLSVRESTPTYEPKKTAQRQLKAPIKNFRDKYSRLPQTQSTQSQNSATSSPQQPKRKGKLMRGRRNPTPETQQQKPISIDGSEDEAIAISSDESEDEAPPEATDFNGMKLLDFFNTCTLEAMVDLSGHKESDILALFENRPFRSLAQIEKIHVDTQDPEKKKNKSRRPKVPFGERLVESATTMWRGFEAVDQLVKRCQDAGKPIATAMAGWGVDVFGAATDGELALTNLDDRDSGIGTPRSSHGSDVEAGTNRITTSSRSNLLKKPANMNMDIELKDYQVVGLNWLNLLWRSQVSGILADDMGLGKTCQVIAFLSHLKQRKTPGPHLIIVPGSTLENWLREFNHFSKGLAVEPYYGLQAARFEQQAQILDNLDQIDVIVTTYDLAYKPADNKFLRNCQPQACVFDEGHVLRNSNTQRYKSLMRIPAKFRLLLTGTPLQNSLRELASILAFIMPDFFREVQEDLEVVFKLKAKVNDADSHEALLSTQRIHRARSMMTPFVLRRKKAQVLKHLPTKTCRVEYCELTETQSKLYTAQMEKQKQVLLDRAAGIPRKEQTNVMMKLRQAAIHPLLFRDRYDDDIIRKISKACKKESTFKDSDPDTIFEELKVYQDYQCHQLATKYPKALGKFELKNDEWMDSGKVQKLAELLKKFKENGDRTLVFSQFTSVMDILQWVLDTLDISYCRLDGQTPIAERQALLDQFYQDESISVFMLSTKSGGAGINLACANKVIIFDSSFNPQDDIQAENRAHRVGQTREVEVIRLVTKGTVEEQIHALGVSKLELDKMVAGDEDAGDAKTKDKLSAAEEMGIQAVEKMMIEQLGKGNGKGDIKDEFLTGLKAAGLDMSAV